MDEIKSSMHSGDGDSEDTGDLLDKMFRGQGRFDVEDLHEIARRLPEFEIISLLGRGGMGVVYKARQPHLDRFVALKILHPSISSSEDFIKRFRREAQALARLNHPNIISIYDYGERDSLFYFVMEYVEGASLRDLIRARSMTPSEALGIVPKVCEALQFAHDEGIVHRDIKPENILIDKRGRVKMADFGVAKLAGRLNPEHTLTSTGMVMGTLKYMAPEQVDAPESVDHRADIYSLGVVLYEMLTGELPRGRFDLPSQKIQVDIKVDEVVLRSLEHDVERRYQRVDEMKTDVERATTLGDRQDPAAEKRTALPAQNETPRGTSADKSSGDAPSLGKIMGILAAIAVVFVGISAWSPLSKKKSGEGIPPANTNAQTGQDASAAKTPAKPGPSPSAAAPAPPASSALAGATKDAPFVNSLGMKFVPVPILGGPTANHRVLFGVWDVRAKDYRAFAKEGHGALASPASEQPDDHPAIYVSWEDAKAFCAWLTKKERASGLLDNATEYRLPSDHEWSCAVGIGGNENANASPNTKNSTMGAVFPWGKAWPPPKGAGNYADSAGVDEFEKTSPVGSFAANQFGLFDMGGNVWQWCEDTFDPGDAGMATRVTRGGAYSVKDRASMGLSCRFKNTPPLRAAMIGFRCVLAPTLGPASTATIPSNSPIPAGATKDMPFVKSLGTKFAPVPVVDGPTVNAAYLVIDLSTGPSATNYPVTCMDSVPGEGWSDEYKTTKLVMRRIPAGNFVPGSPIKELGRAMDEVQHDVSLTKDFYIGVFEVTQKQWERVMGNWPSRFTNATYRKTLPVENVSYYDIREDPANKDDPAVDWPSNSSVNATSFIGLLRARTGLTNLDLPTEAQWEYACRAGTSAAINNGMNLTNTHADDGLSLVGRYAYNGGSVGYGDAASATVKVGDYQPNLWGLYDMHGNVCEWCLDSYGLYPGAVTNPIGYEAGARRVFRGGSAGNFAQHCRSAHRDDNRNYPENRGSYCGLRLAITLADAGGSSYLSPINDESEPAKWLLEKGAALVLDDGNDQSSIYRRNAIRLGSSRELQRQLIRKPQELSNRKIHISRLCFWSELTGKENEMTDNDWCSLTNIPNLVEVLIRDSQVGSSAISALAKCRELRILTLHDCKLQNKDLLEISDMRSLEYLDIGYNRSISDSGAVKMNQLAGLVGLNIYASTVSDRTLLGQLANLKYLNDLEIHGTKVTASGLVEFSKMKPACIVR